MQTAQQEENEFSPFWWLDSLSKQINVYRMIPGKLHDILEDEQERERPNPRFIDVCPDCGQMVNATGSPLTYTCARCYRAQRRNELVYDRYMNYLMCYFSDERLPPNWIWSSD